MQLQLDLFCFGNENKKKEKKGKEKKRKERKRKEKFNYVCIYRTQELKGFRMLHQIAKFCFGYFFVPTGVEIGIMHLHYSCYVLKT